MNAWVSNALFFATASMYVGASILFAAFLFGRGRSAPGVAPFLIGIGALLHAAHIVVSSLVLRICPVEGLHFPISVGAMLMCTAYAAMRRRFSIDVVGAFVAPLALTALLASRFAGGGPLAPSPHLKSAILPVHILVNLSGVALFSLAFAAAVGYLVQEKLLKQKRIAGLFQRLPALDALDLAEYRFLLAGFPLLTLGIITGSLWAARVDAFGRADMPRAILGYLTWVLFASVLLLRVGAGWRGRRAAYGTIAGFGAALLVLLFYWIRAEGGWALLSPLSRALASVP